MRYIYAQCYLPLLHFPFNIVKKHTAYTLLVQLNNYQIQILKKNAKGLLHTYLLIPLNSLAINHHIQIFKKRKCNSSFPVSSL